MPLSGSNPDSFPIYEGFTHSNWDGIDGHGVTDLGIRGGALNINSTNGLMYHSPFGSRMVLFSNFNNSANYTLRTPCESTCNWIARYYLPSGAPDTEIQFSNSKWTPQKTISVGGTPTLVTNGISGLQVYVKIRPSNGSVEVWNAATGVQLAASPNNAFTPGTTPLIGMGISISTVDYISGAIVYNSDGAVTIQVDGVDVLSVGSLRTCNALDSVIDTILVPNLRHGDIQVSTSGDLTGEGRIPGGYWPTGDDDPQWTPSTADSNYQNVNNPTQTVLYNKSNTATQLDAFPHEAISGVESVLGASVKVLAWKDDTDVRSFEICLRIAGTVYGSGIFEVLSTDPTWFSAQWPVNPATVATWTQSDLNAAEIGYRLNS